MRRLSVLLMLVVGSCSTPPGKENGAPNNGQSVDMNSGGDGGANNIIIVVDDDASTSVDASTAGQGCASAEDCSDGESCRSSEERSWNFCGAPMEPMCGDGFVGDSCGHCFLACTDDDECEGTCNGTYCITERTCAVPQDPPP